MAELIAVGFDNPQEADRIFTELPRLQREYLIDLEDAVVAIRQPDGKANLKQSINLIGVGAASGGLSGALWGSLAGLLFLNPLAGMAAGGVIGAGRGALLESLMDYGINDTFIRQLAETLQPNTSALFVLVGKVQPEGSCRAIASPRPGFALLPFARAGNSSSGRALGSRNHGYRTLESSSRSSAPKEGAPSAT